MAKKKTKIAVTYFVTILVSLGLIGTVGYFALTAYLDSSNKKQDSSIKPAEVINTQNQDEYEPSLLDARTVLVAYEPEKRLTASCFILARFLPTENKLVLMPLQSDICTVVDGTSNTLYEFYRLNGITGAVRAVESALDIHVDKYIRFTTDSFTVFSNFMGNVNFEIPYNMVYDNPNGESTVLKAGDQMLDSVTLRKVLTYPNFTGGEEYRARVTGSIAVLLMNSGCRGILQDGLEAVFNEIVNSDAETDITRYDYEESREAIKFVLSKNDSPAQLLIPSGVYNENNCYVLDDSFVESVPQWFGIED